ncbi:hypothetical protein HSBAA_61880 [Vreelandella sulfidaeris]|uniref:Amidohydrolase-related domain-containing protein n=1 Tax=Vreelandella sulfidaeris TaxID=115553 RepID=A0A455UF19_9GAMM|nr:hypothetical protein HSBAA_61880 [Halomonas sulfidaeris]
MARRLPELTIVLDHAGGPLGVGSYPSPHSDHNSIHRRAWRDGLARLAELPNVMLKIGGFGMPIMGFSFNTGKTPPNSQHLADAIAPDVDACIERFTPSRCMLESNFPVDKGSISYGVLWNAYHRLTASWEPGRNATPCFTTRLHGSTGYPLVPDLTNRAVKEPCPQVQQQDRSKPT